MQQGERYDPLPGITGLPKYVWTHLSPRGRKILAAALAFLVVGGTGLAIALAPGIRTTKEERAAEQRQADAERRAELIERLTREGQPRTAQGIGAGSGLSEAQQLRLRAALLDKAQASVEADARARVRRRELRGPIRRVECEPFPRNVRGVGADTQLDRRTGLFACLAVTTDVKATELSEGSAIGHPFRVRVDFAGGGYAWCKISGQAGEGGLASKPLVPVPRACGGS